MLMKIIVIQLLSMATVFACEKINLPLSSSTHGKALRGELDFIGGIEYTDHNNNQRILLDANNNTVTVPDDKGSVFKTIKLNTVFAETASSETLTLWAKSGLHLPLIAELKEFWFWAMKSPFKLRLREPDKYNIDGSDVNTSALFMDGGPYDP